MLGRIDSRLRQRHGEQGGRQMFLEELFAPPLAFIVVVLEHGIDF
jgi:hypothetical protein